MSNQRGQLREEPGDLAALRAAGAYRRVVEWEGHERYLLGETEDSFSLYAEGSGVIHFDLEGRWTRASFELPETAEGQGERNRFRRGVDGRVVERRAASDAGVALSPEQRLTLHRRVHHWVTRAGASQGQLDPLLARAESWSGERLEAEVGRFLQVYRPFGVIPPDRYASFVVQLTQGCAWNGCLFCELYRGQSARVVPLEELRRQIRGARDLVGSGMRRKRGVFLGEANALAAAPEVLRTCFELLHEEVGWLVESKDPAGGVASFVDAFSEPTPSAATYRDLAERGLRRVFVGVESGSETVLQFLRKPATSEGVRRLVGSLKDARISVGAILLVGAGGSTRSEEHVAASAELIQSLSLGREDLVYLSPLVADPQGRLGARAAQTGVVLASEAELLGEEAALRAALASAGVRATVARYDLRRLVVT